jgi:hexosaminidase
MITLFPKPQYARFQQKRCQLGHSPIAISAFDDALIKTTVRAVFHAVFRFSTHPQISLVEDEALATEHYEIDIDASSIVISSKDAIGALYALYTLEQLIDPETQSLPIGRIVDGPKLALRGVMLDIARNKNPKLKTLKELLPKLARLRINHLELYVEGFAMESRTFPQVHGANRPFSISDFQILERTAKAYGIELVGNQNTFGHLTAWLKRPEFHPLAECEDGFVQWGYPFPASTLNPTDPNSIAFVKTMLNGFLPYTRSEWFNINCDEPFELGRGKSRVEVEAHGVGKVYWKFVDQIIRHLQTHGKKAMLWGDVLIHHPEQLENIPDNTRFLDWGYDRDYPFAKHAALLHEHNVNFATCPGTSTWNSFAGRHEDMMTTTQNAVQAAIDFHGVGAMTTDWGDFGHLQYLPTSYYGFAVLGGAAWSGSVRIHALETYLNQFLYRDSSQKAARLFRLLAQTQNDEPTFVYNGTVLFRSIQFVDIETRPIELKSAVLRQALQAIPLCDDSLKAIKNRLRRAKQSLKQLCLDGAEGALVKAEIAQTIRHMELAMNVNRYFTTNDYDEQKSIFKDLKKAIPEVIAMHRRLWLKRNVATTLDESVKRFKVLIQILAANPPL